MDLLGPGMMPGHVGGQPGLMSAPSGGDVSGWAIGVAMLGQAVPRIAMQATRKRIFSGEGSCDVLTM